MADEAQHEAVAAVVRVLAEQFKLTNNQFGSRYELDKAIYSMLAKMNEVIASPLNSRIESQAIALVNLQGLVAQFEEKLARYEEKYGDSTVKRAA